MANEKESVKMLTMENMVTPENEKTLLTIIATYEDEYYTKKLKLEEEKARLLIGVDWEKALDKTKPTVGEKEAFVQMQTHDKALELVHIKTSLLYYKRMYDLVLNGIIFLFGSDDDD